MYTVYVIRNPKGVLYKGFTSDLKQRIDQHNSHDAFRHWTKKRGPWELVYSEVFNQALEARKREKFLKSGQGRAFLKSLLCDYPPKADG